MVYLLTDVELQRLRISNPEIATADPADYCPTCKKTGSYRWRGVEHECDCVEQLSLLKRYIASGVDVRFLEADWSDWHEDPGLVAMAQGYLADPELVEDGKGIFFWGEPGCGKTMLATLIFKALIKRGHTGYATTFNDAVESFTAGWHSNEDKQWFERTYKYSRVVLFDDFGKEHWGKAGISQTLFDNLLRERVRGGRPTFLTTNLSPREIVSVYGEGAMNNIIEQSFEYHFTGANHHESVMQRYGEERRRGERRPIV